MNRKHTKRALCMSFVSLLLCCSMLVGSTFAWFTDTATTSVNQIVSGKLDVALEMKEKGEWVNAEGKTLEFIKAEGHEDESILWEPGCTYKLPELRIKNNGNLYLKYQIAITGIKGDAKLNEAIEWTYGEYTVSTDYVELAPGATSETMTIQGHMKEDAGNEYQNLTIDGIGITVFATQKDAEYDSFDNEYDKNAPTLITVDGTSYATIGEAFTATGKTTFNVSGPIDMTKLGDLFKTANQTVTFNQMEGYPEAYYDFSNTAVNANGANITMNGGYIQGKPSNTGNGFGFQHTAGTITYNNVTINDSWTNENGATVTYDGCTFTGTYYIWTYGAPNVTFKNCTFDKSDSRAILVYSHGVNYANTVTVTDCTFKAAAKGYTGVPAWTAAVEVDASGIRGGATVNITDCTADSNYNGIVRDKAGMNATITVDGAPVVSNQAAFVKAIDDKQSSIVLAAGSYTMVNTSHDVTITGSKDAVLTLPANVNGSDSTIHFKGITIQGYNKNDKWHTNQLAHAEKITYTDCTIKDLITTYAPSDFTNCVFENKSTADADWYSVFAYGANCNITGCTFNTTASKAVKLFNEGAQEATLTVTNCEFNGSFFDKAAIEIDSTYTTKYTVNINNCKTNEFYTDLWKDKSSNSEVYINGKKYVVPVTDPEKVEEALKTQDSVTVDVGNDVFIIKDETLNVPANKELTIESGKIDASENYGVALSAGANTKVTLNDGTYTAFEYAQVIGAQAQGAEVTVNGGTYEGNYLAFVAADAKVTVNGGTFDTADYPGTVIVACDNDNNTSVVTITGGTFYSEAICDNFVKVNITGGSFYLDGISHYPTLITGEHITITGGTFDVDPSAYVPTGHTVVDNGNGTWTVQ